MKLPLPTTLKMRAGWPAITSLCYVTEGYISSGYFERQRAVTLPKDARLKNAIVDKHKRVVKRPILDGAFTPVPLGPGLGLYVRNGTDIIAITGNTLTTNPVPLTKKLRYSVQPANATINTALNPSVALQAVSLLGAVTTGYVSTVSIALSANTTGATLSGTVTTNAVAGVATFNNLKLDRSGEGFKLTATAANLASKVSVAFDIPTRLTFTVQPDDTAPNTTLDPVEVTAKDTAGNTDTQYTGNITLDTYSGGTGLIGTLTAAAVAGIASFANLEFTTTGTFILQATGTRVATAYPPAEGISNSFVIGSATHTLTAVEVGAPGTYGMLLPTGSISPTTYLAATITELWSNISPTYFSETEIFMSGARPQNYFASVSAAGNTLLSANADEYVTGAGGTRWRWYKVSFDPSLELITSSGTFAVTFA